MTSVWHSYLPDYLVEALNKDATNPLIGQETRMDAVVLFADVSGFTAISEALGNRVAAVQRN
ncbi:MAG: hypothetical protein HC806_00430 [Anaerolineae bacterium]|nr:hypothetical protein [Anaerolineae bacterium]